MFVLDTNTLIDFFKGKGNVASKLLSAPPSETALAAVAAYEVWVGVLGSRDAKRRQAQFESFLSLINVVPFDAAASRGAAEVRLALERRGEPIGPLDTLIAGTALAQNASLVTRNVKEFGRVPGLKVVNWYD